MNGIDNARRVQLVNGAVLWPVVNPIDGLWRDDMATRVDPDNIRVSEIYAKYRGCKAVPGSPDCHCPVLIFENEDGRCRHYACEGPHPDCGLPVELVGGH